MSTNNNKAAFGCVGVILFVFLLGLIMKWAGCASGSSSNSTNSSSSQSHTCLYCGKGYSHSGYLHIGSSCEQATGGWEKSNQCCSMKCCNDQWNSNH